MRINPAPNRSAVRQRLIVHLTYDLLEIVPAAAAAAAKCEVLHSRRGCLVFSNVKITGPIV